jgi:hypothetical protein
MAINLCQLDRAPSSGRQRNNAARPTNQNPVVVGPAESDRGEVPRPHGTDRPNLTAVDRHSLQLAAHHKAD